MKRLIFLTIFSLIISGALSSFLFAESAKMNQDSRGEVVGEEGYRIYIVRKGDTLWDITHNILKDPFLWPKVWNANREIRNPDLIYPGQRIRIPLSALRPELVSEEEEIRPEEVQTLKEEEAKVEEKKVAMTPRIEIMEQKSPDYLVDKNLLIASGYISRSIPDEGSIIGSPYGRISLGKGDYIYIKTKGEAKPGDRFYVIKSAREIRHPETGLSLGYLLEINGIIEVIGQESGMTKAEIKESFKEINIGDSLDRFYLIEPPLKPENPPIPKVKGSIVAIRHLYLTTGAIYDIVYVDRGKRDGIEDGSLLYVFSKEEPVIPLGTLQVINTKEETATAVVRKGLKEILVGDRIINE